MRRITTRLLAFLFTAALLLELVPSAVLAVETPYFTAVNDMLLDLDDATMPFWSEGTLYVPDTIFSGTTLGVTYTRSRDKMSVALYQVGRRFCSTSPRTPPLTQMAKNTAAPPSRAAIMYFSRSHSF